MPHKHTRREKDESTFDLPPSQLAKPLPPTTISKKKAADKKVIDAEKKTGQKRKRGGKDADDAPRAFKRLMALANGKLPRNGLDNGDALEKGKGKGKKKSKPASDSTETTKPTSGSDTAGDLKIRPGERLSEFHQRVDAALPISGLVNKSVKNGKDPLGLKVRRTKKERKMHNMYAEWHEIDRKIRERREEERELAEEKEMENEALGVSWKLELESQGKKAKKGKRGKYIGEQGGPEEDPWEELRKKRGRGRLAFTTLRRLRQS